MLTEPMDWRNKGCRRYEGPLKSGKGDAVTALLGAWREDTLPGDVCVRVIRFAPAATLGAQMA
jgi:hypothetical protein